MEHKCKICGVSFEAPPSTNRVSCGDGECREAVRVLASSSKRHSDESKSAIGAAVRHGKTNKIPFSTRWSEECEIRLREHIKKTGESRVATLERLVREHLD